MSELSLPRMLGIPKTKTTSPEIVIWAPSTAIPHQLIHTVTFSNTYTPLAIMIKTLPFRDIEVPVPGFGAMGISFALGNNMSYAEAEPVLLKALELGCTFWDTAVCIYALTMVAHLLIPVQVSYRNGVNEQILGDFIRKHNVRDKIFCTLLPCHARY